jgi:hypothetical protein
MNEKELISQAMRLLGKRTSKRKKKSSRANVKKAWAARRKKFKEKASKSVKTAVLAKTDAPGCPPARF